MAGLRMLGVRLVGRFCLGVLLGVSEKPVCLPGLMLFSDDSGKLLGVLCVVTGRCAVVLGWALACGVGRFVRWSCFVSVVWASRVLVRGAWLAGASRARYQVRECGECSWFLILPAAGPASMLSRCAGRLLWFSLPPFRGVPSLFVRVVRVACLGAGSSCLSFVRSLGLYRLVFLLFVRGSLSCCVVALVGGISFLRAVWALFGVGALPA